MAPVISSFAPLRNELDFVLNMFTPYGMHPRVFAALRVGLQKNLGMFFGDGRNAELVPYLDAMRVVVGKGKVKIQPMALIRSFKLLCDKHRKMASAVAYLNFQVLYHLNNVYERLEAEGKSYPLVLFIKGPSVEITGGSARNVLYAIDPPGMAADQVMEVVKLMELELEAQAMYVLKNGR